MKLLKIKVNSDMESTIVSSLLSQVDRPNEIKHCGPNEHEEIKKLLKKESGSTSEAQDSDQAPPPPPPPTPPPRSQSTKSLNVQEQLQQLKPVNPQLAIQDVHSSSKQKLKDLKPEIQNSQSQVLDSQFEQNATMHQCRPHQHLNLDDSDLQFAMSLENQQQQPFQQQSFQQQPFQLQQFQQQQFPQPMQDGAMMSYDNHSGYYYQHQNQPINPIIRPERPYDANFMSPLSAFNTFGAQPTGGKNSINKIIEDLRSMLWSDERMLCFLNVFHQFYNGPTSAPNGEHVIVFFKENVPPLFKRSFITYTTKGMFIIFYFYFCIKHFFAHNYMLWQK